MSQLDQLQADIEQLRTRSEVQKHWQPEHTGSIDIRIAADGNWYHEGRPFLRQSLVKLFASVMCREGDDYFLLTPAEKLKIVVEDAPLLATLVDQITENQQSALVFTTNIGDRIVVDSAHPIRVEVDAKTQIPRPYVHYRDGLDALITRSAFYDLINLASEYERNGKHYLTVSSLGQTFDLGCIEEEQ